MKPHVEDWLKVIGFALVAVASFWGAQGWLDYALGFVAGLLAVLLLGKPLADLFPATEVFDGLPDDAAPPPGKMLNPRFWTGEEISGDEIWVDDPEQEQPR